jgi:hypothetical protein
LSQSGKSTFITSLINQLLNHESASLPGFPPVLSGRLNTVRVHSLEKEGLPLFPYQEFYKKIASEKPRWPDSTQDVSGCLLEFRLTNTSTKLNPFRNDQYSVFLEIRDYPGEWLLDLPLLDMSFSRWCAQCNAQYTTSPRRELMGDLLAELQGLDPLQEAEDNRLSELSQRFKQFLHDCKYKSQGLSLIQPGRFLIPGTVEDQDILNFVPLLKCSSYTEQQLDKASKTSYFGICRQRYQQYLKQLVKPFYKTFFSRIDRQLVLVDVINTLQAGPEYLDDMQQAMTNITDSFSYGSRSRFLQAIHPKVDKVVFAATKVDQVVSAQHEAVKQLLGKIIKQAYKNAAYDGVTPLCEAVAAVRSSKEMERDGRTALTGYGNESGPIGYIHPKIPDHVPVAEEWEKFLSWKIPKLQPPAGLSYRNSDPMPHIRMDTILNALIGDKC